MLEDLGYEAVDNAPLPMIEELVTRGERPAAVGVDTRSRGFNPATLLQTLERLKLNPALRPELVFAWAEDSVLIRRYTETRRRHPLAPRGRVIDGIIAETMLVAPLRETADLLVDTSDLAPFALRARIEARYGGTEADLEGLTVSLISFAYPKGLPRDADLVFDARFLRNPHYDPILRPGTGLDPAVAAFVEADEAFEPFLDKVTDLLTLLLPRFVEEGKKYLGVAVGCTGGRHRSVHVVESLVARLAQRGPAGGPPWRVTVTHRELTRLTREAPDRTGAGVEAGDATHFTGRSAPEQARRPEGNS
ncbi:MAG: RNase adapter RapZ [Rhodospirillales bacterium]